MGAPKGTRPPNAGKGRKTGVPNKATQAFRETVQALLDDNRENVSLWLAQVANGVKAPKIPGDKTKLTRWLVEPNPAKALDLLGSLGEFAAPKLSRTEHVGENGGPVRIVASNHDEAL